MGWLKKAGKSPEKASEKSKEGALPFGIDINEDEEKNFKNEFYNIIDLYMLNILQDQGHKALKNQGFDADLDASEYLRVKLGCSDPRVSNYNVLKLTHEALEFERIFVFYDDQEYPLDQAELALKNK